MNKPIIISLLLFFSSPIFAQSVKLGKYELFANQVHLTAVKINGKAAVRVLKDTTVKKVDGPTFAKLVDADFKNGTIELKVLSR